MQNVYAGRWLLGYVDAGRICRQLLSLTAAFGRRFRQPLSDPWVSDADAGKPISGRRATTK